jgi:hypothetical protein
VARAGAGLTLRLPSVRSSARASTRSRVSARSPNGTDASVRTARASSARSCWRRHDARLVAARSANARLPTRRAPSSASR